MFKKGELLWQKEGVKESFYQDNSHKINKIENSKNVTNTEHFGFTPARGSAQTPHQVRVWKKPILFFVLLVEEQPIKFRNGSE